MGEHLTNEGQPATVSSSIGWALLGLLIERPSYGYELVHRFERIYGDMLALTSVARIYNALETLSSRSLIEETPASIQESAVARQPKRHYRVTPEGMQAYEAWLVTRAAEERRRSRLFAQQLAMLEPEAALEVIDRYELENLDDAGKPAEQDENLPEPAQDIAKRLEDEDERLALGVRLTWTEYARQELKALIEERDKEQ